MNDGYSDDNAMVFIETRISHHVASVQPVIQQIQADLINVLEAVNISIHLQ